MSAMSPGRQLPTGVQKALEHQAPWGFSENYWGVGMKGAGPEGPSCPFPPGSVPSPDSPLRCDGGRPA